MSAADYYGTSGSGGYPPRNQSHQSPSPYPSQPQHVQAYTPSHSPYPPQQTYATGASPYPSQPQYAQSPAPPQSNHLAPYPSQPQYSRPGSAHSDAGYPPPYPDGDQRPGSAVGAPSHARPHSADPYSGDRGQHAQREGEEGEKGLGATLIGGGAGGFLGHKLGKGKLGTVLGSAVGAVAANMIEHRLQGRHSSHGHGHHGSGGGALGFLGGGASPGHGHHHHGSSHHGGSYYGDHHGHHGHGHHGRDHHGGGW
ncbi:hypothetical protein F4819DRAFT_48544 [Hypoxylon fuscum]|nr:hypothetical protein F4819DRAFT_48544 [Hypoxylon fuscum]